MWEKPRASILQRPVRPSSYINQENLDTEFTKEEAKIQAKRERFAQIEERLRMGHGEGTAEDRQHQYAEDRQHQTQAIQAKRLSSQLEKEREQQETRLATARDKALVYSEEETRQRRREAERQTMLDNMAMVEERRRVAAEEKRREQAAERHNAAVMGSQPRNYR